MTDYETRCCPHCDSPDVSYRTTKTPDFRCHDCLEEFDEYRVRQAKVKNNATSTLTAALAKADPDDVGAT